MQDHSKERRILFIGLGLPIVMLIVLSLSNWLPRLFVSDPLYNVLFTTNYYPYTHKGFQFQIENNRLKTSVICTADTYSPCGNIPIHLYLYDVKTKEAKEIKIDLPFDPAKAKPGVYDIKIPELADATIDGHPVSPDGYIYDFQTDDRLFFDLFYRRRSMPTIKKYGRVINILPQTRLEYYPMFKFIGWIKP